MAVAGARFFETDRHYVDCCYSSSTILGHKMPPFSKIPPHRRKQPPVIKKKTLKRNVKFVTEVCFIPRHPPLCGGVGPSNFINTTEIVPRSTQQRRKGARGHRSCMKINTEEGAEPFGRDGPSPWNASSVAPAPPATPNLPADAPQTTNETTGVHFSLVLNQTSTYVIPHTWYLVPGMIYQVSTYLLSQEVEESHHPRTIS